MNESPAAQLTPHLAPDEQLLWSGRPRGGLLLRAQDCFLIPASLLLGGFYMAWGALALAGAAQAATMPVGLRVPFFLLFGVGFVLAGLHLIIGRFFLDWRQRAATVYGVTNKRVIIISGIFRPRIRSIHLRDLGELSYVERSRGVGTIVLDAPHRFALLTIGMNSWPLIPRYAAPGFDLIPDAAQVLELLRKAARDARPRQQVGIA